MAADPLLHAAVINNARWCDAVCRSHGYPGQFTGRLWTSVRHALPFYPNVITLSPDATAAEVTDGQNPSRPFAIKDSFARLDLAPHGLTPLFDATWIAVPTPAGGDDPSWGAVTDRGELVRWEAAWAGGAQVGGAIAYTAGGVTGISNVFKSGIADDPLWAGAVRAIARARPGLPIVGYERGEDLAAARQAGFTVLGPLRIWARGSAVP
jgi:hypothetical protein